MNKDVANKSKYSWTALILTYMCQNNRIWTKRTTESLKAHMQCYLEGEKWLMKEMWNMETLLCPRRQESVATIVALQRINKLGKSMRQEGFLKYQRINQLTNLECWTQPKNVAMKSTYTKKYKISSSVSKATVTVFWQIVGAIKIDFLSSESKVIVLPIKWTYVGIHM